VTNTSTETLTTPARVWPQPLLLVLAVGAAVRLLLWLWFAPLEPRIWDENDYAQLARTIAVAGEFAYQPGQPTSIRPPLYPAFVAGVYHVAGVDNYQAIRLAQALLSLVIVVILHRLGREVLASERAALWLAALFCFYPSFLGYNNLILTEVLFTFWLTAGVYALSRALNRDCFANLAVAGVLLALGALTRSVLWLLPPVLSVFLLWAWKGGIGRRTFAIIAFAAPFALVIAPWAVRNTKLQQTFIPVDCMSGRNFMMGNYEHTPLYRSWDAISLQGERFWIAVLFAAHPEADGMTQGQIDQLAMKEGIRFIREHPGLTLRRDVVKFFDFWGLERELIAGADRGYFGAIPRPAVIFVGLLVVGAYALVLFASAFGAALNPPIDRRQNLLLLLVVAFICGAHTVVFAHSRYHLPVIPFVLVYAAAALAGPRALVRHPLAFWLATLFCVVIVTGWAWNAAAGDFDKLLRALGLGS
jgi:4-amino-4-deoxy-L-arabinose transferase-like glycosyltransferase